jgi:flagellar hook-basal body complex protein FliE
MESSSSEEVHGMKTKKDPGLIPDAAKLDRKGYVTVSLDKKGVVEKTLREANSSFGKSLHQTEEDLNSLHTATGKAAGKIAAGEKANVHDVMAALDKARHSYDRLVEDRDRMMKTLREALRKRT